MWNLLGKCLVPPLAWAVYYREALAQAVMDVIQNVTHSRRSRWETGRNLEELAQRGYQDTPPYRAMSAAYQQLSAAIGPAEQWLKDQEDRLAAELGGSNPLPSFRNFAGIDPLGPNTLGPAGRAGVVSSGPDVVALQKFLKVMGYYLTATGEFDLQTRLVLQQFQKDHHLPTNDIVGADTRKWISDVLEGK